jgi:hypothetical protein
MLMAIPIIDSAKRIEQQFRTGEEPVLVMCSDVNLYVCKYMRSSAAAYKLACELIGARMAEAWQLDTPDIALVRIKPSHWAGINQSHSMSAPSIGSRWMDGVVDITPSTYAKVPATIDTLEQLMKIALFDFWIANEDRNANNANLMYDVIRSRLVSIDYGCILNTATFEYPLSQLTTTDTILWSDLFRHLAQGQEKTAIQAIADRLKEVFSENLQRASVQVNLVIEDMPEEWNLFVKPEEQNEACFDSALARKGRMKSNVPQNVVKEKLLQLLDERWTAEVWDNFMECLNDNTR